MDISLKTASYGFIGLGLIGGSIARAIRAHQPSATVIAFDPDQDTLSLAKEQGVLNEGYPEIGEAFRGVDILFLCAPVEANLEALEAVKPYLSEETTLTDIGSVKGDIHEKVKDLGLERQFVGGHPMAGSERSGYRNAKASLLENAYYILTYSDGVELERLSRMTAFAERIGAIPLTLTPEDHDAVTGAVSHLPHVISAALVNYVKKSDDAMQTMRQIAAGGFKDITRISSSSPNLWKEIVLMNRDTLVALLDGYLEELRDARNLIANRASDGIRDFFASAKDYREDMETKVSGPILQTFVLYVDIADEAGQIVSALSLISDSGISIKNIGITHNREAAFGSMMLEFYDEVSLKQSHALLYARGYAVAFRNA